MSADTQGDRLSVIARNVTHDVCSHCGEIAGASAHGHANAPDWRWEQVEYVPADSRGAVVVTDAGIVRAERWMLNEMHDGLTNRECIDAILSALRGQ